MKSFFRDFGKEDDNRKENSRFALLRDSTSLPLFHESEHDHANVCHFLDASLQMYNPNLVYLFGSVMRSRIDKTRRGGFTLDDTRSRDGLGAPGSN